MLEVEVKASVNSKEKLLEALNKLGVVFGKVQEQVDHVFVKNAKSIAEFYQNEVFIRIREQGTQEPVLTLKKKQQELASLEYETTIDSTSDMSAMLGILGFEQALTIRKSRVQGAYKNYTVCLDEVEGLGSFIEVEQLVEEGDIEVLQQELFALLISLGLTVEERVYDAYDTLLLKKYFQIT